MKHLKLADFKQQRFTHTLHTQFQAAGAAAKQPTLRSTSWPVGVSSAFESKAIVEGTSSRVRSDTSNCEIAEVRKSQSGFRMMRKEKVYFSKSVYLCDKSSFDTQRNFGCVCACCGSVVLSCSGSGGDRPCAAICLFSPPCCCLCSVSRTCERRMFAETTPPSMSQLCFSAMRQPGDC